MLLALQGMAGHISQSNKQEGQITYHSHSNSKLVELQKTVARWTQEMLTLAEKRVVAWLSVVTESWLNLRQRQMHGECKENEIYKMWALLLVILPGKRA